VHAIFPFTPLPAIKFFCEENLALASFPSSVSTSKLATTTLPYKGEVVHSSFPYSTSIGALTTTTLHSRG